MLSHRESLDKYHTLKLRTLTTELPPYCKDFFRGIEPRTLPLTRIAYAYDLKVFFQFLLDSNPSFKKTAPSIREITLEMLDTLTVSDIEEYMDYLKYRQNEEKEIINQERAIKRKVASLKSFYKYFYEKEGLSSNPLARVPLPKLHEKEIVRMEIDEVTDFLDTVEQGIQLRPLGGSGCGRGCPLSRPDGPVSRPGGPVRPCAGPPPGGRRRSGPRRWARTR